MSSQPQLNDSTFGLEGSGSAGNQQAGSLECFGVQYQQLVTSDGGDLWLTRYGQPYADCLQPENWFKDRYYLRHGEKMAGATGAVFRVDTVPVNGRSLSIIVKFSRVGQEVPLEIATTFPDKLSADAIVHARFNSPFEEFGLVTELRESEELPGEVRIRTQRPLGIYAPATAHALWKLGRSRSRFAPHQARINQNLMIHESDQQAIELDIRREYVMLYGWVEGRNAEEMYSDGLLTKEQFEALTPRVVNELGAAGFRVLDNKPKHFILRKRPDGELVQRRGKPVYALVDFELLVRTESSTQLFREKQRSRYWQILHHDEEVMATPEQQDLPGHLRAVRIFGVDYLFGAAPNGGLLWVLGRDPALFDYFLPDRWRRTPRVKLSAINEVFRTRTRDNIYIIYRRSRVGEKPHVDPFYEAGRRIRQAGYNSPFEEFAISRTLHATGISTIYPRAIYRTGHESAKAPYMADNRRFQWFDCIRLPEIPGQLPAQPLLDPDHDYYTIWGQWRGLDPLDDYREVKQWGFIDATQAREQGLLTDTQYRRVVDNTMKRLVALGFSEHVVDASSLLLIYDKPSGGFHTDERGELEVTLSVNALSAYDAGVLTQDGYREVIEHEAERLERAGFQPLNLKGHHLLLTVRPDGTLRRDRQGNVECTLCNFELIRMKYCQL